MNGMKGLVVNETHLQLVPDSDGTNLIGKVYINNPSPMTVELGNVSMDLSFEGVPIGTSNINDMTLKPGPNKLDMRSITDVAALTKKIIADKTIPTSISVTAVGNTSVYNGVHLPYYEASLRTNKFTISLDLAELVKGAQKGGEGFKDKASMISAVENEALGGKTLADVKKGLKSTVVLTTLAAKLKDGAGQDMLDTLKSLANSPGAKVALEAIKSRLSSQ
jgi:LEA14-like dessication related protein